MLKRGTPLLLNLAVFLLFITSIASGVVPAQVTTEWATRYNGPINGYDSHSSMAVDDGGKVYVTGSIPVPGAGATDYATVKYDSDGNELWVVMYNGPGDFNDYALAIAVDPSGNLYVAGYQTGVDGTSDSDWVTVKCNKDGRQLWVATYDGPAGGSDSAVGIALDAADYVCVTGTSTGSDGTSDYATITHDIDSNELWVATYGFSNWQEFSQPPLR